MLRTYRCVFGICRKPNKLTLQESHALETKNGKDQSFTLACLLLLLFCKLLPRDNDRITVQHLEGFTAVYDDDGSLFVRRPV